MATRILELQESLFNRLNDNISKSNNFNGIYDYVPENITPTYITLGAVISDSEDTKTDDGEKIIYYLELWSESKGKSEILELVTKVEKLLEETLELKTAEIIKQKINKRTVLEEEYGLFHGTIEIEFLLQWI